MDTPTISFQLIQGIMDATSNYTYHILESLQREPDRIILVSIIDVDYCTCMMWLYTDIWLIKILTFLINEIANFNY